MAEWFAAVPTTPTWGEENKGAAFRTITRSGALARVEHRVASADANPELCEQLQLMVLANMEVDEIHQRLGLPVVAIQAWEAIFFDAREMRQSSSWVEAHVIGKETRAGNHYLASRMRLAIAAGPVAGRAMLDADVELPLDEAARLYRRTLKLHLKFDQALNMPLDSERSRLRLIEMVRSSKLEGQRIELARERLALRCQALHDRHQGDKLRLELAKKRAEIKLVEVQAKQGRAVAREAAKQRKVAARQQFAALLRQAEKRALAARIAASPLAKLTWGSGVSSQAGSMSAECAPAAALPAIRVLEPVAFPSGVLSTGAWLNRVLPSPQNQPGPADEELVLSG